MNDVGRSGGEGTGRQRKVVEIEDKEPGKKTNCKIEMERQTATERQNHTDRETLYMRFSWLVSSADVVWIAMFV